MPRSFMSDDGDDDIVLFEEFGGNPTLVNFRTDVVGSACGSAYEGRTMELSCSGRKISAIRFAGFGDPRGGCGSYRRGTCASEKDALPIVVQVENFLFTNFFNNLIITTILYLIISILIYEYLFIYLFGGGRSVGGKRVAKYWRRRACLDRRIAAAVCGRG